MLKPLTIEQLVEVVKQNVEQEERWNRGEELSPSFGNGAADYAARELRSRGIKKSSDLEKGSETGVGGTGSGAGAASTGGAGTSAAGTGAAAGGTGSGIGAGASSNAQTTPAADQEEELRRRQEETRKQEEARLEEERMQREEQGKAVAEIAFKLVELKKRVREQAQGRFEIKEKGYNPIEFNRLAIEACLTLVKQDTFFLLCSLFQ